jgi:Aspartyl protease
MNQPQQVAINPVLVTRHQRRQRFRVAAPELSHCGVDSQGKVNSKQISGRHCKHNWLGSVALALILLLFAPTTATLLQAEPVPATDTVQDDKRFQVNRVPFTVAKGEVNIPLILVQATVNGKSATLIFDSGAQALGLAPELVKGVKPMGKVNHSGVGGGTVAEVVPVDIQFGSDSFHRVLAETNDMKPLNSSLGVHIDGFLGECILSQYKTVTIDYANRVVIMSR